MTGQHKQFGDRERERLTKLFRLLGSLNDHEAEAARGRISSLLNEFGKGWSDLIELLSGNIAIFTAGFRADITALGSTDPQERADARRRIMEDLAQHRATWNDLADKVCAFATDSGWVCESDSPEDEPGPGLVPDLLGLIVHLLKDYVSLREHEYVVVALWVLHTHCFDRFPVTPRLVLRSPVAACGKSVLINIMARLAANPVKFDSVTVAAIVRLIDKLRPTLLVDEADNLALGHGRLRSVFNSGWHETGTDGLTEHGEPRKFTTFAPLVLALPDMIGGLPRTLNSRSITLTMERYDGQRELRRLDVNHPDPAFDATYGQILLWRRDPQLQLNPDPPEMMGARNRTADNWRVLLSVADSLGAGLKAREAMAIMVREHQDADVKVLLLADIRRVFNASGADRLPSSVLLTALHDLDDADWCEFTSIHGEQAPHRLRPTEMASMLRAFGIKPRSVWPLHRTAESKSAKGYLRSQFETAWRKYCAKDGTTAHGNNIKTLRRVDGGTV